MSVERKHVFISFKTQQKKTARHLMKVLKDAGFAVWWQEDIQCGQEWHGEIDKAISQAGAIVVLWSKASMASPWVRHEASQAIAKNIYAPARIEMIEIESPYDRIQATDIVGWAGDIRHHGIQNLFRRLLELIPPPLSFKQRLINNIKTQIATISISIIATLAFALLLIQSHSMRKQIQQQALIYKDQKRILIDVNRSLNPIEGIELNATILAKDSIPGLSNYISRLREQLYDPITGKLNSSLPDGVYVSSKIEDEPVAITIGKESMLWPSVYKDTILYYTLNYINLSLSFNKDTTINIDDVHFFSDLTINTDSFENSNRNGYTYITWDLINDNIFIVFKDTPSPISWHSTGEIVSIPDLKKSFVSIGVTSHVFPHTRGLDPYPELKQARKYLDIKDFRINSSGQSFHFQTSNMYKNKSGYMSRFDRYSKRL